MDKRASPLFDVSDSAQAALIDGARDVQPVSGLTHNFYRYPARFSPAFVRAAIEAFTEAGDYVLNPYFGGGTSLVEAVALGRSAVGVDISELAEFVATVKTTVLSESELQRLEEWAATLPKRVHIHRSSPRFDDYAKRGYYKHLDHPSRWRLRKAIEQALGSALPLRTPQMEAFARCVVLCTAQWALDGRLNLPSIATFREMLSENAIEMIAAAREFRNVAQSHSYLPTVRIDARPSSFCGLVWFPAETHHDCLPANGPESGAATRFGYQELLGVIYSDSLKIREKTLAFSGRMGCDRIVGEATRRVIDGLGVGDHLRSVVKVGGLVDNMN